MHKTLLLPGGGRPQFFPPDLYEELYRNQTNEEESYSCPRRDQANLVQDWLQNKSELDQDAVFVDNVTDLNNVDPEKVDYLMGLFSENHIPYIDQRDKKIHPSLQEMTHKAIEILQKSKNENGFFLMVEGARIDQGHHNNWANRALEETLEFDDTIEQTLNWIKVCIF